MADIHQREDESTEALAILDQLLNAQMDGRLKGRAYLVEGRVYENNDEITKASRDSADGESSPVAEPANPARERRPGRADVHEPNAETEKTAGGADARAAWMSAGDARNKTPTAGGARRQTNSASRRARADHSPAALICPTRRFSNQRRPPSKLRADDEKRPENLTGRFSCFL